MGPQVSHQVAQGAAKDTPGTPKDLTRTPGSPQGCPLQDPQGIPKHPSGRHEGPQESPESPPSNSRDSGGTPQCDDKARAEF